jgi:RNAse (barnase) inhibitor barstar
LSQEFQDQGGFTRVLNDIFNPTTLKGMELDSVYQLKLYTKKFYQQKFKMSEELLETLDAINNVRPEVIKLKRKYFD